MYIKELAMVKITKNKQRNGNVLSLAQWMKPVQIVVGLPVFYLYWLSYLIVQFKSLRKVSTCFRFQSFLGNGFGTNVSSEDSLYHIIVT